MTGRGYPDCTLIGWGGLCAYVEVKRNEITAITDPHQLRWQHTLKERGHTYFFYNGGNGDDIDKLLEWLKLNDTKRNNGNT